MRTPLPSRRSCMAPMSCLYYTKPWQPSRRLAIFVKFTMGDGSLRLSLLQNLIKNMSATLTSSCGGSASTKFPELSHLHYRVSHSLLRFCCFRRIWDKKSGCSCTMLLPRITPTGSCSHQSGKTRFTGARCNQVDIHNYAVWPN